MYLGIDVGATRVRLASMASLDNQKIQNKTSFLSIHNFGKDFLRITQEAKKISNNFEGIGIGLPGVLDKNKSTTYETNNLIEWEGRPIKESFQKEFGCPVIMDNDAIVAALGEVFYSGVKGNFAYLTWGTGLGGAMVENGAGKIQVRQLDWKKYLKSWEKKCSGINIKKRYGKPPEELIEGEWRMVMKDFLKELKKFINRQNPESIIFGGGIALRQTDRLKKLIREIKTGIKISSLGEDTGLYGAFGLLRIDLKT